MKDKWKQRLEEMQVQLALGEAEGKEAFETQKRKMREYVEKARIKLIDLKALSEEERNKLRARLEEAEVQLALGKAEGRDAYDEQKSKLENALHNLQEVLREVRSNGDDRIEEWKRELDHQSRAFQMRLDIYRLHFELGQAEARDRIEEYRRELKKELHEAKERLGHLRDESEDRWDVFTKDISQAVKKLFS